MRWDLAAIKEILATPRKPDPKRPEEEELEAKVVDLENDDLTGLTRSATIEEGQGEPEQGAPREVLERPMARPSRRGEVRELRITKRLLEKYGYTPNCPGCTKSQSHNSKGQRPHTAACRTRIYLSMQDDPEELERLEGAVVRVLEHENPEGEPQDGDPGPAGPSQAMPGESQERSRVLPDEAVTPKLANAQNDAQGSDEPAENVEQTDDLPVGSEDMFDDEELVIETVEDLMKEGAVEVQADDQEAPTAGTSTRVREEDEVSISSEAQSGEMPAKKQRIGALRQMIMSVDIKRIIDEIEQDPIMKLRGGNHRQRRTASQRSKNDVSEIYSPPRMTRIAEELGLKPGFSLDLTVDDEDGQPWDLSDPKKREKARRIIKEQQPELIVACPMCGPFSSWMQVNYTKVSEKEVRQKLYEALKHLKFALEICKEQHEAGRLFVFEHPVQATSWGTRMMKRILNMAEVEAVNFDFCSLGMRTTDDDCNYC